jgi:nicotinamide-nucleotide amidase
MDLPEAVVEDLEAMVAYLMEHGLYLATAESCTAGLIAAALGSVPGGGKVMESGYVVYSPTAKQRLLNVSAGTIDQFGLTSEQVAREMATGALHDSEANVAVATTGVAGPDPMDDIAPGTVCFAWAFTVAGQTALYSTTQLFDGDRQSVIRQATCHALSELKRFHQQARAGKLT